MASNFIQSSIEKVKQTAQSFGKTIPGQVISQFGSDLGKTVRNIGLAGSTLAQALITQPLAEQRTKNLEESLSLAKRATLSTGAEKQFLLNQSRKLGSSGMGSLNQKLAEFNLQNRVDSGTEKTGFMPFLRMAAPAVNVALTGKGLKTLGAMPVVKKLTTLGTSAALSGTLGAVTGQNPLESAVGGLLQTPRIVGLTGISTPLVKYGAAGIMDKFTSPLARNVVGRGLTGLGNVVEDEILSRLDGIKPGLSNRVLSFGLGALLAPTKEYEEYLQSEDRGVSNKIREVIRDLRGRYAKKIGVSKKSIDYFFAAGSGRKVMKGEPPKMFGVDEPKIKKFIEDNIPGAKQGFGSIVKSVRDEQGNLIKPEADLLQATKGVEVKTPSKLQVGDTLKETEVPLSKQASPLQTQESPTTQGRVRLKGRGVQTSKLEQSPDDIIQQAKKEIGTASQKPNKPIKQVFDDLYTQWVDRYNPLVRASTKAKGNLKKIGAELRPEYDPEYLVRRLSGAGGIADNRFKTELNPIIKQIEDLKIDKTDMDVYLANKRIAGFGDVGRDVFGADPVKARQVVNALEVKYGDSIQPIANKLYEYQNKGFQEMVDAGFISPENAKIIQQQNPDYSPLYRVMDEVDDYLGLPTRKTMQGSQPIQKIKGSTRQIESPLESIIGNTYKQRAAIEKNRVANSIVGLQDMADMGFEKVAKSGNDTITIWRNGEKEYWKVGQDIAETAKGANEESMNLLLKILQTPASILRQGATGRNPEFMIPNIVRDQLDASITSKYGYIPFVDYTRGLVSMLRNDDAYKAWQSSGAKIDLGEMSGKKTISKLFDEKTAKKGLFSWLSQGLDVMGKYSEQPTRVGLFKKAYEKTGNELLAAMESRDSTVDFARMGSKMKVANSIVPFLNVGVQGFDKLIRSVKNNPGKVLLNMALYGATPAIATTMYNLKNYPEEYKEIPQYEKDDNFVIVRGRNENGNVDYISFPKGNILPVVANPTESFLNFLAGNDQRSFGQLSLSLASNILPVIQPGQSLKEVATKTIGSNLPQAIKPITENLINKSFYKYDPTKEQSKEIVPYYLQKKEPFEQSYEWTPKMYKVVGAALNVSPLKVQNLMEGYLAGFVKIPANIIDSLSNISRGEDIEKNKTPLLRRFIKETYPSSGKPPEEQPPKTPFWERVTGKASASSGTTGTKFWYKNEDGNNKSVDTQKVASMPSTTEFEKLSKEKESYKMVDEILTNLTPEQQAIALSQLGIPIEDATYYNVARNSNDLKTAWVNDTVKTSKDRSSMLETLVSYRREVNGSMILADGVVDNLFNDGTISESEKTMLKNLKIGKDGKVKTKLTGRGKKVTLKKVSVPKSTKLKVGKMSALMSKAGKMKSKKYKFRNKI